MKNPNFPILIIDDEEDILLSYKMVLQRSGLNNLILCHDSEDALRLLQENKVSVILLDLVMPGIDGKVLLKKIQERYPQIPVIVVTGTNAVPTAVECMQNGAYDFMLKPVDNVRLSSSVKRALDKFYLELEVENLKGKVFSQNLSHKDVFRRIVTADPTMHAIFKYVEAISDSLKPVLITGESGVGKDLIAGAIHRLSYRTGEYVSVNVGGLDDTAFSDSLFGHKKGAFTGAHASRKGLVLKASNGTLFLDEIGELENSSQVKLLQLLQNNEYYPLGSDIMRKSSVKIIAATNQDIERLTKNGQFRNDLYYRLNIHRIHIPPLRDRINDIPILVDHFVDKASTELKRPRPEISKQLMSVMNKYPFPGNIRELESMIYNAVSLYPDREFGECVQNTILGTDMKFRMSLPLSDISTSSGDASISYTGEIPTLQEVEEFFIDEAMKKVGGNQTLAAKILGISQSTLSRRFNSR
jgi:DNA-binding NtrC family response regulator